MGLFGWKERKPAAKQVVKQDVNRENPNSESR